MLQPRQQYGLGSLVKSAVKGVTGAVKGVASGIKDFAKSDLGKAAIMAGIGFGIPGTSFGGLFGRAGFGRSCYRFIWKSRNRSNTKWNTRSSQSCTIFRWRKNTWQNFRSFLLVVVY
jgi:hypothetical protein